MLQSVNSANLRSGNAVEQSKLQDWLKNAISLLCCVDKVQADKNSLPGNTIEEILQHLMPACESNREKYAEIVEMMSALRNSQGT